MKDFIARESKITNPDVSQELADRFWSHVNRTNDERSCWEFPTSHDKDGYPYFYLGWKHKRTIRASRFVWLMCKSPIPEGLVTIHRCDNPACVRPSHLLLGTRADNSVDMVSKHRSCIGEKHPNAKLTLEKASAIRTMHKLGTMTIKEIAALFGITYGCAWEVCTGRRWNCTTSSLPKKPALPVLPDNAIKIAITA
jgi:hypothetical protein